MPTLLHMHWLWAFGGLSAGIVVGWLTFPFAAPRSTFRPAHVAAAATALCLLLALAKVLPVRYGARLEVGILLAIAGAIGCAVGSALRDLAEFTPPANTVRRSDICRGDQLLPLPRRARRNGGGVRLHAGDERP